MFAVHLNAHVACSAFPR